MAYNFGGNNPRIPHGSSTPNQSFPAMANLQQQQQHQHQQGLQQQGPYFQHGPQQGYPPRQGYPGSFAQFPGNMVPAQQQMQRAYNPQQQKQQQQQYKKMMEQQQKMAQESQKMQNEMRKKRDFEIQQKKLQQFGQGGGVKRAGGGDLTHLIGSLAHRDTDKHTSSKPQVQSSSGRSLFARPGTSYPPPPTESLPTDLPTQEGIEQHPVGHQQPYNPQQQTNYPQKQPNFARQQQPNYPQQQQQQQPNYPLQQPSNMQQPNYPLQQPNFPQQQSNFSQQQPYMPQQQPYPPQQQPYPPQQQPINHQQQVYHAQQQPKNLQQPSTGGAFGSHISGNSKVNDDDEFSDFQEAKPSVPISGGNISTGIPNNKQGTQFSINQSTTNQPTHLPTIPGKSSKSSSLTTTSMTGNVGWTNQTGINTSSWNIQGGVPTMAVNSQSSMQSGVFAAHSALGASSVGMTAMISSQRERTDSQSSMSSNSSSGLQAVQGVGVGGLQNEGQSNVLSNMASYAQYSQEMTAASGSGRQMQGNFPSHTIMPGITNIQPGIQVPGNALGPTVAPGMTTQQFGNEQNIPKQVGEPVPGDNDGNMEEESEESKLEKLYGIVIPDWCSKGDNLPGIYKDVKEAATVNGDIDTSTLYPILLASDLPRDILGQIWSRVNKTTPGQLNDVELRMMLGLLALGQTGLKVERLTLEKLATCRTAPIPSIPENILQPTEGNWSFQKEPKPDSTTLSLQNSNFQNQLSNLPSSQLYDKYSAFKSEPEPGNQEGITPSSTSWSLPNLNPNSLMPQPINTKHGLLSDKDPEPIVLSSSPEFQGFQSAMHSDTSADFGGFKASDSTSTVLPSSNPKKEDFSDFKSTPTANLAISLESLELRSVEAPVKPAENSSQKGHSSNAEFGEFSTFSSAENSSNSSTTQNHVHNESKNSGFGAFPVIKMPPIADTAACVSTSHPLTLKMPSNLSDLNAGKKDEKGSHISPADNVLSTNAGSLAETTKPVDKYDFLRDLGDGGNNVFSQSTQNKDDSFGDFEGFKQADTSVDNNFGEFGDFQSTALATSGTDIPSSSTQSSNNWGFNALNSITPSSNNEPDFTKTQTLSNAASSNVAHTLESNDDFGDFESIQSQPNSSTCSDIGGLFSLSNSTFKPDMNTAQLGGFLGSNGDSDSREKSSNLVGNNFTNTVPLDSAQRYKQLCGEEEDPDQHASVWGRCLNSCLLTLTTCAVAVQTMSDPGIKQEVLQSKKGVEYFTAVIEVFKVTKRVQVSLMKTDFINEKLKDVLDEINQTWKNITNFLTGTNFESNLVKETFTGDHVQADEDRMLACGLCLLNVKKTTDSKLTHGGREYHSTCANFWCNRVDSILPSLWPVNSLI